MTKCVGPRALGHVSLNAAEVPGENYAIGGRWCGAREMLTNLGADKSNDWTMTGGSGSVSVVAPSVNTWPCVQWSTCVAWTGPLLGDGACWSLDPETFGAVEAT